MSAPQRQIDISVIVPFHGREPFIRECTESLLAQTYPADRREIIFIDNGVIEPARKVIEEHAHIRLLREPQPGAYVARNTGLREALGHIIAFTDADCAVDPAWLAHIAAAMSDPGVSVLLGAYVPARRSFALSALAAYENEKNRYIFGSNDAALYYGYTNNMAVRAALFSELGPFLPRPRGSDALFVGKVVERFGCRAVRYSPDMRVRHLEVGSAADYYRKVFVHSRSVRSLRGISAFRPLNGRERMLAFRGLLRNERYSAAEAIAALALLAGGMMTWLLGMAWRRGPAAQ
jgi:glycosyltransferase involved in cell wall biosynthesis